MTIDPTVFATRTANSYYDPDSVNDVFGSDSEERLMDATEGRGYAKTDSEGRPWAKNPKTGEIERLDERTFDRVYAGADTEREATPEEAAL